MIGKKLKAGQGILRIMMYESVKEMDALCREYLNDVFGEMYMRHWFNSDVEWDDNDWWMDNFIQPATNSTADIEGLSCDIWTHPANDKTFRKLAFTPDNTFAAIKYINNYYATNYGDDLVMDWKKMDTEFIIRNYVHVYALDHLDEFIARQRIRFNA